jgi:hypothetical protein
VRRTAALALAAVVPLLMAARDPKGDVVPCGGGGTAVAGSAADMVAVDGQAAELGTAAVWRITFAQPLPVPDHDGPPLRIDVLVRDPLIAPVTLGDERGMNRIVRWTDTGADALEDVRWVYERSNTTFNPPAIDGRTVTITVPGRILLGEAENGTENVERARWSVLVRDGDVCDRVGDVPVYRLRDVAPSPSPTVSHQLPSRSPSPAPPASGSRAGWVITLILLLALTAVPFMLLRRRSS